MWPPADLPKVLDRGEQLRLLYRSSLSHFPPHDQQHAIQFDLLINLLNLLAATSTCPTPTVTQRAAVAIDDMNDDELFFHVLQQELTSVNRHFEESAGAILAKWAAYTRDTSSRSASSRNSQDLCCPRMDSLTESCDSSHSGASSEDPCLHQQKTRQVHRCYPCGIRVLSVFCTSILPGMDHCASGQVVLAICMHQRPGSPMPR